MDSGNLGNPNLVYCNLTKRLFDPEIEVNYGPIQKHQDQKKIWFELVKNDYSGTYSSRRLIVFSKININIGGAINNSTKQFKAPIESWYQFYTSGHAARYDCYVYLEILRNNGRTETDQMYQRYSYSNNQRTFKTTMFSKYLKIGDVIKVYVNGYEFYTNRPFTFRGHSIP